MVYPLLIAIFNGFCLFFASVLIVILLKRGIMKINYSRKNINKIIRNNIRYIRKYNKLSQERFAEQVDLRSQFVGM